MAGDIRIGVHTDAQQTINKFRELGREVDNIKKKFADLQKQSGRSPSGSAPSAIPTPYGNMPLAGSIVPPRTTTPFAALSHVKGGMPPAALSRAGSGSSPVMWGPAFRASMHQMMPGHYAHQTGAAAALAQLQGKPTAAAATTSATATNPFTRLTSAIDRLTSALTKPKTTTISPTSATAALNPFVTLQSQSGELQALQAVTASPSGMHKRLSQALAQRPQYARRIAQNLNLPASVSASAGIGTAYEALINNMMNPPGVVRGSGRTLGYSAGMTPAYLQAKMRQNATPPNIAQPSRAQPRASSGLFGRVAHAVAVRGVGYEGASILSASGMSMGDMLAIGGATAGVGLVASYLSKNIMGGYNTYQQSAPAASNLWHTLASGGGYNAMYSRITGLGRGMGISNLQAIQSAQSLAATGGNAAIGNGSLSALFGGAVGLGYGANGATTLAQQLAELQRLGITSGLSATATNRSAIFGLGNATIAGGMQGRSNSLLTGITNLIQTLDQQRTTAPNFAKLLGMMTTMSKSGLQALQGSRGANMLSTFNSALTNPGGGPAGQLFMYNALTSGTNLSPFGEMYLAQQGLTGSYGGQTNLQRVMQYATKMFPSLGHLNITKNKNGQASIGMPTNQNQLTGLAYVSGVFGMSMPQTQALMAQFVHNGKFSMSNMNAESQWWGNIGGMPKSTSMAIIAAQLFNSRKSAKGLTSVVESMKSGGFTISTHQEHLLALAKTGNKSAMKQLSLSLGHEMQNGKLLTAEDQLIKATNNNSATWVNIGKKLTPLVNELYNLNNAIGKALGYKNPAYPTSLKGMFGQSSTQQQGAIGGAVTTQAQQAFVKKMLPYAQSVSKKTGVPANDIIGQWAFESKWGLSQAATQNLNFGGIGPNRGISAGKDTSYAGYSSLSQFANNYAQVIKQKQYAAAIKHKISPYQFGYNLTNGGYDTTAPGVYGAGVRADAATAEALAEGVHRALSKKGSVHIHVHVPPSAHTNLGLEQWSVEQRAMSAGGFP